MLLPCLQCPLIGLAVVLLTAIGSKEVWICRRHHTHTVSTFRQVRQDKTRVRLMLCSRENYKRTEVVDELLYYGAVCALLEQGVLGCNHHLFLARSLGGHHMPS
jgi:hypothetical protein